MCHHHTSTRKRPRSNSLAERRLHEQLTDNKENNSSNEYEARTVCLTSDSGAEHAALKRQRSRASPTAVDDQADAPAVDSEAEDSETEDEDDYEDEDEVYATPDHRDEIVAALLTITSALGLSKETLHVCVDVLDRYMQRCDVDISRLEALSIACLWIAVKFVETPITIACKSIKQTLQRRRLSSNWTWDEILDFERSVLQALDYRVMAPTLLSLLQQRLYTAADNNNSSSNSSDGSLAAGFSTDQRQLAFYFADLLLLTSRAHAHSSDTLASAAVFVAAGRRVQDAPPTLLAPVLLLFVAHRDNINPSHPAFKARFALRCQFGARLQAPWRVPYDPSCGCRVCAHMVDEQESASV